MNLKQYCRYQVDFKSRWLEACPILMGLAFFLSIVYYFAIASMRDVAVLELVAAILLGVVLTGSYVVCITCLHLNAPGLYAIIGTLQCLMLIILNCMTGDTIRIVFSIIWYILAAMILLATAGGYLPGRLLAALMFFVPLVVRLCFYDLGKLGLLTWVRELPILLVLAGIAMLEMGLKSTPKTRQ